MFNESKWPNFGGGVVREKNKRPEEDTLVVNSIAAKQELEKMFPESVGGKINKRSSFSEIEIAMGQQIRGIDWQISQQLLESVDSPEIAVKIYRRLANCDQFGIDWDTCNMEAKSRYDFLEKLTEQAAQDPAGFAMLKKDIEKPQLGIIFRCESDGPDKNFDFMKSLAVKALFKANPSEAGSFAISFLTKLQKKNESSSKKRGKWQEEMGRVEENIERKRSASVRNKDKQEPPYGELLDNSWASTVVLFEDFHRTINAIIESLGKHAAENNLSEETVGALTNYLTKDHTAFGHTKELAECFEKTGIDYSAKKLLGLLRDPEVNPWGRKIATNILYRLEFGRLGISSEGVKYLERVYDLGEYNNPGNFVKRLTRDGDVGIFDESRELVRYFRIGDLNNEAERVKAEVLSFAYETLFIPKISETEEERAEREGILQEFKQKYFQFFDDRFFGDTGVAFNNFSFREQGQFMHFVENSPGPLKQRALELVRKYGEDGFRSFLSLEYGMEMGETVLGIGEANVESGNVRMIFKDYARVIDFAEDFYRAVLPAIQKIAPKILDEGMFLDNVMYAGRNFLYFCSEYTKDNPNSNYRQISEEIKRQHLSLNPADCVGAVVSNAVIDLVNQIGLEKTRDALNIVYRQSEDELLKKHIDQALSFINPPEGKPVRRVDDLYQESIRFETYAYSTHDFEEKLMKDLTKEKGRILDLGCGTGRIMIPLLKDGREVIGLDYTKRHVQLVKEKAPEADVLQGDWTGVGLTDDSVEVIYSLGRNILHEYHLDRQRQLFAEANRLLREGGLFVFDIPDREKGHYHKSIEAHRAIMEARGITNFRKEGLVYDSPDENNFSTRYLYGGDDIEELAKISGFKIKAIKRAELNNGYGDVNLYYVLEKIGEAEKGTLIKPRTITNSLEKAA